MYKLVPELLADSSWAEMTWSETPLKQSQADSTKDQGPVTQVDQTLGPSSVCGFLFERFAFDSCTKASVRKCWVCRRVIASTCKKPHSGLVPFAGSRVGLILMKIY